MKKTLVVAMVSAMFLALPAWADVTEPMVRFLSTSPSVSLTVYHPFAPAGQTFPVGVVNVVVDLPDGEPEFQAQAYCIDLKQTSSFSDRPYGLHPLEIAPNDGGSVYSPMGVFKANAIRELWGEHGTEVVNGTTAAAFQAAIWEIIYENSNLPPVMNAWDLNSGNLSVSDAAVAAQANAWLASLDGQGELDQTLWALTNFTTDTTYQDLVFRLPGGDRPPVPEPLTVATVAMGLSGLGMYIRRRTIA